MSPKISNELAAARRTQILDAALRCFSKLGLDRATLRDISQEAELSLGSIYHYFRTKAELIEAIRQRSTEAEDAEYLEDAPQMEGQQVIDFAVDHLFDQMNDPASYDANRVAVMLWAHALLDEKTLAGQLESLVEPRAQVLQALQHLQESGHINPNLSPRHIGNVILGMLMGVQIQKTWEPEIDGRKAADVTRAMLTGNFWIGAGDSSKKEQNGR